jgi:DNA-binding beta-propeller fold protein YncE
LIIAPLYNISVTNTTKWRQNGIIIYDQLVLGNTRSMYVHDDGTIYTIHAGPTFIIEWKPNIKNGRVVAGANKVGSSTHQLLSPQALIVDKKTDSIIICDDSKKQILRFARQNAINEDVIISDIDCFDLAMDDKGYLYVSDIGKDDVKRWEIGVNDSSILVAGGNGRGNHLGQFFWPVSIVVDTDYSLYVVDKGNDRVMKWMKDAKEGIVVAGGNDKGYSLTQLNTPLDVIVDHLGNVYVTDSNNYRVMRWIKGATEGSIVLGGKGSGNRTYQFKFPVNLSFDKYNNLYVYDQVNRRIQKFYIASN